LDPEPSNLTKSLYPVTHFLETEPASPLPGSGARRSWPSRRKAGQSVRRDYPVKLHLRSSYQMVLRSG